MHITLFGDFDVELASKPSIRLRILELYIELRAQRLLGKADFVQPQF